MKVKQKVEPTITKLFEIPLTDIRGAEFFEKAAKEYNLHVVDSNHMIELTVSGTEKDLNKLCADFKCDWIEVD